MSLNLSLQALTVPFGTEFPGTVQGLLDLIAQYEEIAGEENFNGLNYGATTPDAADRDKPWFKTDNSGNPIGFYSWNGADWILLKNTMPSGSTASRPSSPSIGDQYFDTDINAALIYERSAWRTLAGTPGDVKYVYTALLADALTANPGWSAINNAAAGRTLGVAGSGSGLTTRTQGESIGSETHVITQTELPSSSATSPFRRGQADANSANPAGILVLATGGTDGSFTSDPLGDDTPMDIMNPTLYLWALVKD